MPKNDFDGNYQKFVNDRVRPILEKHGRIFVIATEIEDGMYTAMVPLFATRNRKCIIYFKEDGVFDPLFSRNDHAAMSEVPRITFQEITASFPVDTAETSWAAEVMNDLRALLLPSGVLKVHTYDERTGQRRSYSGGL